MPGPRRKDLLDDGEVEALQLPPGPGRVLELDLHDRQLRPRHVEEEAVGLAVAETADGVELDPGRGNVVVRVGREEVVLRPLFVTGSVCEGTTEMGRCVGECWGLADKSGLVDGARCFEVIRWWARGLRAHCRYSR